MRIVLLGPPGTGKGSLARLCHERVHAAHVSTGEIFRHEIEIQSALGKRVAKFVTKGKLVPDALVIEVMTKRLVHSHYSRGFILDGFPRTRAQAVGLDAALKRLKIPLSGAVYIASPETVLVRRLSGRRVCEKCGANFHLRTMRPKKAGVCDHCRGELITRADDAPATIRKRLSLDHKMASPLLNYYAKQKALYRVDGRGHIETVYKRALKLFRKQGWVKTAA